MKWWHQASGVERAAAVAICGFCGYSTVKELGGLLLTSKDKLVNILTPVFGRYHLTLNALKSNCIKLFLKAGSFEEFRHWLMKTKDYSFQRELCFAMEEASNQFEEFHNTRVPFNPEHFHLMVFSLDGTEINSDNLAKYMHKVADQVNLFLLRLTVFIHYP